MAQMIEVPSIVAPTMAQQAFVIGSGVAGGLAGIAIARGLAKVNSVSSRLVFLTTAISVLATLGAGLYLSKKAQEGAI